MLTATYIYHSCFLIETDACAVLIDYWRDNDEGRIAELTTCNCKPLYILASHFHDDHFNPAILSMPGKRILSRDILKHRRAQEEQADCWLRRGETYEDELIRITACPSTDVGCSFAIEIGEHTIFHAGDLGDWQMAADAVNKKMQGDYLAALRHVKHRFPDGFELAMLPVDPRLGSRAWLGAEEWLERIPTGQLMPMHYTSAALPEPPAQITCLTRTYISPSSASDAENA